MAIKYRFRKDHDSFESKSMPAESSALPPLPYYPNLRRALASHGAALLVIYLELHFPAPQDSPDRPVKISQRQVMLDLQLGLWTYKRYRSFVATWWPDESRRRIAAMAGREFYRPDKRCCGTLKCYSFTATGPDTLSLRRNTPRLLSLLDAAGVSQRELAQFRNIATQGQGEREIPAQGVAPERPSGLSAHSGVFAESLEAIAARSAEVAARGVARKLDGISGLGDGRRKRDLVRAPHNRRPWTEERRQKVADAWARRRAESESEKSAGFEP